MARQRNVPRSGRETPAGNEATRPDGSLSALAWASFVREYNRRAAELWPSTGSTTLGALTRGEYAPPLPPLSDAQRADFFAKLVDELAPIAQKGLNARGLVEQSSALARRAVVHAAEVIEQLQRRDAGLRRGPAARSEQARAQARNHKDAGSLYYEAAVDYAFAHPDARRDDVVAFLLDRKRSLPPRGEKTVRRYIAGAIDAAKERRAQSEKSRDRPQR
jgi:hypothetical protein